MDSEDWYSWDEFYKKNKIEEMPWFEKNLDKDVEEEIIKITKGNFLDLGTGPGTQALESNHITLTRKFLQILLFVQ